MPTVFIARKAAPFGRIKPLIYVLVKLFDPVMTLKHLESEIMSDTIDLRSYGKGKNKHYVAVDTDDRSIWIDLEALAPSHILCACFDCEQMLMLKHKGKELTFLPWEWVRKEYDDRNDLEMLEALDKLKANVYLNYGWDSKLMSLSSPA